MSKTEDGQCTRCSEKIEKGIPKPGKLRFTASVKREVWKIRFSYLRMRSWEDAPKAMDVVQSATHTDVILCDGCWGDVLNFICTTRPEGK